MRDDLLFRLHSVTDLLHQSLDKTPSFDAADSTNAEYQRLCEFFATCRSIVGCRGVYLMKLEEDGIHFGPESYSRSDPQASPLGELYHQPPDEILPIFGGQEASTAGPYTDEYGTFVSAFAAHVTHDGDRLVLGMDIEASRWRARLRDALVTGISLVLLPVLILLLGGLLLSWRELMHPPIPFWLRWTESWLVPLLGIALTAGCVYFVHQHELLTSEGHFVELAESQCVGTLNRQLQEQEQNLFRLANLLEVATQEASGETVTRSLAHLSQDSMRTKLTTFTLLQGPLEQLAPWRQPEKSGPRRILSGWTSDGEFDGPSLRLYLPLPAPEGEFRQLGAVLHLDRELMMPTHPGSRSLPFVQELLLIRPDNTNRVLVPACGPLGIGPCTTWPVYVFGQTLALRVCSTQTPTGYLEGLSLLVSILGALLTATTSILVTHALLRRREREELYSELAHREDKYRSLIENANEAILVVKDRKVVFANTKCGHMMNQDPATLIGMEYSSLLAPEFREAVAQKRQALLEGKALTERLQVKIINGHWIEPSATLIHWEEDKALMIVAHDISDWVELERARQELEGLLHSALEQSPIAMIIIGTDLRVRLTNITTNQSFSSECSSFEGLHISELMHIWKSWNSQSEELRLEQTPLVRAIREGCVTQNQEAVILNSQGLHRVLHGSAAPVRDKDGKIIAAVGLFQDITELRRYEEKAKAGQRLENMGSLAGGVAHDLNNLLTPIIGYCEILAHELKEEDQLTSLSHIRQSADLAQTLVKQLLAFGRQQELRLMRVSLNDLILEVLDLLRRGLAGHTHLDMQLGDRITPLFADASQIKQVLLNLVLNARDAMPKGGQLSICTSMYHNGDSDKHDAEWVMLEIRDTGIGMSEEVRTRLFEPFFTTKEEGKGTGLGLATVHGIVHQHGGRILVESEPGIGSSFKVLLPPASTT